MRQLRKFKLSMPNTGLMFLIAGMAVANYSYDNYKMKYMSSSTKHVEVNPKDSIKELLEPNAFVHYNQNEGLGEKSKLGNISANENAEYALPTEPKSNSVADESVTKSRQRKVTPEESSKHQKKPLKAEKLKKSDKHVKTNYI